MGGAAFGECPLYFSALQKSQDVFRSILITQSPFNYIKYNSRTVRNSTQSYSCISYGHSLVTQEFPVIVNSYQPVQFTSMWNCHTLFVMQHDNNTFPTNFAHRWNLELFVWMWWKRDLDCYFISVFILYIRSQTVPRWKLWNKIDKIFSDHNNVLSGTFIGILL